MSFFFKFFLLSFYIATGSSLFAQYPEVKVLEIGSRAPDFRLPGTDDKMYSLSDFNQYSILAIIFSCNHCPTAQAYEDKIISMVNEYRPQGVGFVVISPNSPKALSLAELGYSDMGDELEDMKIRSVDKNFNFPYLYDGETQETSIKYGPVATPHVFIFDNERILRYTGRIDDTENPYVAPKTTDMRNALNALLNNREVPVIKTKTFGCSIKWSWKDEWTKKVRGDWANAPVSIEVIDNQGIVEIMNDSSNNLRLINVWATWCGPCIIELPEFITIDRMYRGRDFEFITISADKLSKKDKALSFLKKIEASNKNFIFGGGSQYDLIEAVDKKWEGALPYTALVAPGGEVIYSIQGTMNPLELKKKIVNYLGRYYADDK